VVPREEKREMNGNADSVRLMFREVLYAWTQCGGHSRMARARARARHDGQAGEQPTLGYPGNNENTVGEMVGYVGSKRLAQTQERHNDVETLLMRG
jgi:hypothetical protein